jgi:hypothetical protein
MLKIPPPKDVVHKLYAFYVRKILLKITNILVWDAPKISETDEAVMLIYNRLNKKIEPKTIFKFLSHDVFKLWETKKGATIEKPHIATLDIYASIIRDEEHEAEFRKENTGLTYHFFNKCYKGKSTFVQQLQTEHYNYNYISALPFMLDIKSLYHRIVFEDEPFLAAEIAMTIIESDSQKLYLNDVLRLLLELATTNNADKSQDGARYFFYLFFAKCLVDKQHILRFISQDINELRTYYYLSVLFLREMPAENAEKFAAFQAYLANIDIGYDITTISIEAATNTYREILNTLLYELQDSKINCRRIVVHILERYQQKKLPLNDYFALQYFKTISDSGTTLNAVCLEFGNKLSQNNSDTNIWNMWLCFYWRLLSFNAREAEKMLLKLLVKPSFAAVAKRDDFGRLVIAQLVNKNERHSIAITCFYKENWHDVFQNFMLAEYFTKSDIHNLTAAEMEIVDSTLFNSANN